MTDHVTIQCTMTAAEAWSLAQFLKRVGFSEFRALAKDDAEAYDMQTAGIQVANALRDAGYAPR
jgi:hypothetical protein